jgi:hypothetical protein
MEDRMLGALEIDLKVPDHLKGKFAEMPPVFENIHRFQSHSHICFTG